MAQMALHRFDGRDQSVCSPATCIEGNINSFYNDIVSTQLNKNNDISTEYTTYNTVEYTTEYTDSDTDKEEIESFHRTFDDILHNKTISFDKSSVLEELAKFHERFSKKNPPAMIKSLLESDKFKTMALGLVDYNFSGPTSATAEGDNKVYGTKKISEDMLMNSLQGSHGKIAQDSVAINAVEMGLTQYVTNINKALEEVLEEKNKNKNKNRTNAPQSTKIGKTNLMRKETTAKETTTRRYFPFGTRKKSVEEKTSRITKGSNNYQSPRNFGRTSTVTSMNSGGKMVEKKKFAGRVTPVSGTVSPVSGRVTPMSPRKKSNVSGFTSPGRTSLKNNAVSSRQTTAKKNEKAKPLESQNRKISRNFFVITRNSTKPKKMAGKKNVSTSKTSQVDMTNNTLSPKNIDSSDTNTTVESGSNSEGSSSKDNETVKQSNGSNKSCSEYNFGQKQEVYY